MKGKKHLQFKIGDRNFAVSLAEICKVVHRFNLVPLPSSPAHLKGVTNLRGEIVSVVDFSLLVGGDPTEIVPSKTTILMIDDAEKSFGILTEESVGITEITDADQQEVDPVARSSMNEYVSTMCCSPELIFIIDVDKLRSLKEAS